MSETVSANATRRWMEDQAGLVVIGPDESGIEFSIVNPESKQTLNYKSLALGGYNSEAEINAAIQPMIMNQTFVVYGNAIRLQRQVTQIGPMTIEPVPGVPQGVILVWRQGHEPQITVDNGIYEISLAYAVLPPFAKITSPVENA